MSESSSVFDMNALQCSESTCREQLTLSPDNMDRRLRLAWCLFLQSLHQDAQEEGTRSHLADAQPSTPCCPVPALRHRSAQILLEECLHQTYTVMHLSVQPQVRSDVEKLHALVRLVGAQGVLLQAEERANHLRSEMARAIQFAWEEDR